MKDNDFSRGSRAKPKFESGNEQFEAVCKSDATIAHALAVLDPARAYNFKHAAWAGWLAREAQPAKPRPIRFKDLSAADAVAPTTCTWSVTDYVWSSSCGMHSWEFTDGGTPAENGMKFCHRCSKPIAAEVQDDE